MGRIILIPIVVVLLVALAIGGYQFRRWFNWEYGGYRTQVEDTVRSMVKPEALRS